MKQTALLRFCIGGLLGIAAFTLGLVGQAYAHPTARYLNRSTSIRITHRTVLGHPVRVCSWRPGDRRVRAIVRYSRTHLLTVPGWAGAGRKTSRAACSLNGGTYRTAAPHRYRPSGTVYAQGRRIRGVMDAPAVGFLPGGRVVFGAQSARRRGSGNVMNGLAMLVEHGHRLLSHRLAPWTTRAQFACGAPGTDGVYGCSRSSVVQFRNGRVGLVEVMHASMPAAATVLKRMGARAAITFDSGGAAGMWTLLGRHNTLRTQVGRYIGATMGSSWHRHIPDAIVVNARKA